MSSPKGDGDDRLGSGQHRAQAQQPHLAERIEHFPALPGGRKNFKTVQKPRGRGSP
jgi:hypothetical protein